MKTRIYATPAVQGLKDSLGSYAPQKILVLHDYSLCFARTLHVSVKQVLTYGFFCYLIVVHFSKPHRIVHIGQGYRVSQNMLYIIYYEPCCVEASFNQSPCDRVLFGTTNNTCTSISPLLSTDNLLYIHNSEKNLDLTRHTYEIRKTTFVLVLYCLWLLPVGY